MKHIIFFLALFIAFKNYAFSQIPPLQTIMEVEGTPNSDMMLGTGMLGLGDINNDGYPDFAVGARNIGKVLIYFGGPGILDSTPDIVLRGGEKMAMGDLNGDNYLDLITRKREDTLFIYYGHSPSPLALDTVPDLIIHESVFYSFGQSFAVGDLNNDGFDDLVVGAVAYDQYRGKVYVYLGKNEPNGIADFVGVGDTVLNQYGISIKINDINGDGVSDLVIGTDDNRLDFSILDIFYGHIGWTYNKDNYNQRLDSRIVGLRYLFSFNLIDVNSDNKADISTSTNCCAYFFYGTADTISTQPSLIITNPDTSLFTGFFGPAVNIGDINKDGKKDFAIRAMFGGYPMCVLAYLGNGNPSKKPVAARCRGSVSSSAFENIVPVGDVNGDGVNDFGGTVPFNAIGFPPQDGYFAIYRGDSNYVTSIQEVSSRTQDFSLSQNYPNPFNSSTTIEYTIPKKDYVRINIYNCEGKKVVELLNGIQEEGTHRILFDAPFLSSGVYFYKLVTTRFFQTNKMLLLK
jgi:hypothetical protein